MSILDTRGELTIQRLVLVGTFLVVSVATAVLFAQAVTGHLGAMHAPSADVTVVDYEVTDDALLVTLRVNNPTVSGFDLRAARLNAYVDGMQVTDGTTTSLDDVSIRSGETRAVSVSLGLREGGEQRLRDAASGQVDIRGRLRVYVVDELVYVPVDEMEVDE